MLEPSLAKNFMEFYETSLLLNDLTAASLEFLLNSMDFNVLGEPCSFLMVLGFSCVLEYNANNIVNDSIYHDFVTSFSIITANPCHFVRILKITLS